MTTKKWQDVRNRKPLTDEQLAEGRLRMYADDLGIPLAELRRMNDITQVELAHRLAVTQPAVSELERSTAASIATVRRYVEALGGHLEVSAVFDDGRRVPLDV